MTWESLLAIAVLFAVLFALARNWAGPDLVLLAGATFLMTLSLFSDKFPTPKQMAAEFGNEGLLIVAVLFVVATALTETGGMSLITERILGRPKSVTGAQARMMLPVTAISAFL